MPRNPRVGNATKRGGSGSQQKGTRGAWRGRGALGIPVGV